jgi:hypothetical protein
MFYSREQTKDNQIVSLQIIWRSFAALKSFKEYGLVQQYL